MGEFKFNKAIRVGIADSISFLILLFLPILAFSQTVSNEVEATELQKLRDEIKELSRSHESLKQYVIDSPKRDGDRQENSGAFRYRGHFQLRSEIAQNQFGVQDKAQSLQTFFRLRTYLTYSPNDKLAINLTPQAAKIFGGDLNNSETSGSINHGDLQFFEANIIYQFAENFGMKAGRQEMDYGDGLIIGSLGWSNNGRSFDAFKLRKSYKNGWTDVFSSKISDNGTIDSASDDINLHGVYHSQNFNTHLNPLDLYFIYQRDAKSTEVEVSTFGLRIKGKFQDIFYRTENGAQNGENLGGDAFQSESEVGYAFGRHSLSALYSLAGKNYRQLYPTGHKFLGFADVLGRRNVEQIAFKYSYPIDKKFNVNLSLHRFNRHNTNESAYRLNGSTQWGNLGNNKHIGDEVDFVANYTTDGNLTFQLGVAVFGYGDYMKAQSPSKTKETKFLYLQLFAPF